VGGYNWNNRSIFILGIYGPLLFAGKLIPMTLKILEHLWVLFIAVGGWMANKLMDKITDLDKGKASSDDLNGVRNTLNELDKKVDGMDHATQLRLVPRPEYKMDVTNLHIRISEVAEKLGTKQDRIKEIRVANDEKGK